MKTLFLIYYLYLKYSWWKALFWGSSITSWCVRLYPCHWTPRKSLIGVSTYQVQIALPAALRLLWVLIIPKTLLVLCRWTKTNWKLAVFPRCFLTLRRSVLNDGSVYREKDICILVVFQKWILRFWLAYTEGVMGVG